MAGLRKITLEPRGEAFCYDPFSRLCKLALESGDAVDWKRNGRAGHVSATLLGFDPARDDGRTAAIQVDGGRRFVKPSFEAAYRNGLRLGLPGNPVDVVVEEYEAPTPGGWAGHVRAFDEGRREFYWNLGAEDVLPHLKLPVTVGDRLRLRAVHSADGRYGIWGMERNLSEEERQAQAAPDVLP